MIRAEDVSDIAAIHRVVTAAFASVIHSNHKESLLVDELRNSGALSVSMVAECNGQIVGHVAFSPVTVDGHLCDWYGLAPLAVVPVYQRRGIGTRLATPVWNRCESSEQKAVRCLANLSITAVLVSARVINLFSKISRGNSF